MQKLEQLLKEDDVESIQGSEGHESVKIQDVSAIPTLDMTIESIRPLQFDMHTPAISTTVESALSTAMPTSADVATPPPRQISTSNSINTNAAQKEKRRVDEFGFYLDSDDANVAVKLTVKQKKELMARETIWLDYIQNWSTVSIKKQSKIKKMCRLGIPDSVRPKAWKLITGADAKMVPGKFEELCADSRRLSIFEVVERDINRCFPNHVMFSEHNGPGQVNLRKVLRAYALYNPDLGYCQGMGMLVGLLLMRMSPEDAFWILVVILEKYIPDYHSSNLYQLRVDAAAFEVLLKKNYSSLAKHMHDLIPLTYMTQWFLTLYTLALPWNTALRLWDMFLHDGPKALFRAGLAILSKRKNFIIKKCPTSSDILQYVLVAPKEETNPDEFIKDCLKIKLSHQELEEVRTKVKKKDESLQIKQK